MSRKAGYPGNTATHITNPGRGWYKLAKVCAAGASYPTPTGVDAIGSAIPRVAMLRMPTQGYVYINPSGVAHPRSCHSRAGGNLEIRDLPEHPGPQPSSTPHEAPRGALRGCTSTMMSLPRRRESLIPALPPFSFNPCHLSNPWPSVRIPLRPSASSAARPSATCPYRSSSTLHSKPLARNPNTRNKGCSVDGCCSIESDFELFGGGEGAIRKVALGGRRATCCDARQCRGGLR